VIDNDGRSPALGLCSLTGAVDDERIQLGEGAEHRLGIAFFAEGNGLARQPFEIAVLAVVDDGLRAKAFAQPKI
jgi:hypothetical protein